jgi:5'-3' exonuclease
MISKYAELLKEVKKEHLEVKEEHLNDRVLIVDGLNQFIRVFGAVPALNDDGEHCGGITGFLLSTAATIRIIKPTRVVVVFDGKGGSQRRKSKYSGYKEGRTGLTKINRLAGYEDLEDQQQSMRYQFARLIEYLQVLPVSLTYIDHVEADDIIAYLANHYFQKEVVIVSSDKDFLQLINPRIKVWSSNKKKMYDESLVRQEYGELELDEFINECSNVDEKLSKKLMDNVDVIRMNFDLMQLRNPEISSSITSNIRNIMDGGTHRLDIIEFKKMFMGDKLYTAFADVDSWLRNSFLNLDILIKKHLDGK